MVLASGDGFGVARQLWLLYFIRFIDVEGVVLVLGFVWVPLAPRCCCLFLLLLSPAFLLASAPCLSWACGLRVIVEAVVGRIGVVMA